MRHSVYFSNLKNSIADLVKRSTDTTDSKPSVNEQKLNFYREFMGGKRMRNCHISAIQTVPRSHFHRTYALYVICVETDDLKYEVKKRYSEFEHLYHRSLRGLEGEFDFPKKTYFQSGTAHEVTSHRLHQLNKLIEEIGKDETEECFKFEFYNFIQLYQKYEEGGIAMRDRQKDVGTTDDYLMLCVCRLNEMEKNALEIFELIKLSISDRKKRITYDVAKQMLAGFNECSGLVPLILSEQNELVLAEGLKLLNYLFSPETNRDYQIFCRILQKYLPNNLVIDHCESLADNSQLKLSYFSLLNHYLSLRQDLTISNIAKFYETGATLQMQFSLWQKFNRFTSNS